MSDSSAPLPMHARAGGRRFVLANTEQLHTQIERMAHRVRELEHGLGAVYATISKEKHPLLSGEDTSTQGSSSVDVPMFATPPLPVEPDSSVYGDDVIDCFGARCGFFFPAEILKRVLCCICQARCASAQKAIRAFSAQRREEK